MGLLGFALLMLVLLWFALTNASRFCVAALLLSGLPMTLFTGGQRFFSGALDVDAQALFMFAVMLGAIVALTARPGPAIAQVLRRRAILALVLYAAASLAWALSLTYGVRMLTKLTAPLAVLAVAAVATDEGLTVARLRTAICGAGILSLALAVINAASGGALAPRLQAPGLLGLAQLSAPFTSPADFSFTLCGALFMAYGRWAERRNGWSLAIAMAMIAGLLFALCRAAIAGAVLGLFIFHLAGRRAKLRESLVAAALVLSVAAVVLNTQSFKARMFFNPERVSWAMLATDPAAFLENVDTSGRDGLWRAAVVEFHDTSAAIGGGIGSVDRWIRERYVRGDELHSDVFRLYLDLGILGLCLYALAMLSLAAQLLRRCRSDAVATTDGVLARVGLAALACYCSTLLTDNTLNYVTQFGAWVFAVIGVATSGAEGTSTSVERDGAPPPAPRRFAHVLD